MDFRTIKRAELITKLQELNLSYNLLKSSYEKDIEERNRAERKLLVSEEKFRKAFIMSPDSININRLNDGMYISINNGFTKITGYSEEEAIGKTSVELSIWVDATDRDKLIKGLREKGEVENMETRFRMKNGTIKYGIMSAALIDLEGVTHILSITRDITDRRLAEEKVSKLKTELEQRVIDRTAQLEAANSELQAFAYSVSHDLRAPLRAIDGFSKFVLEDYGSKLDTEGQRLLGLIRSNTQKMDKLITDILSLSKVTRDDQKKSKIDMRKMALSMFNEAASHEIQGRLKFSIDPLPEAKADPAHIKQVWINLISNAIKFSSLKAEPKIKICGYTENGYNIYYVNDNGVGFNPEYSHKLFGVFQRLHKADEFEGTGVGLAIVQRIIHRHGGKVWAEGKEGKGATFYFSLPV